MTVLPLFAGGVLALLLVLVANRHTSGVLGPYAVGLVIAALVYVLFAVVGRATPIWLGIETVGLVVFGVAAWVGVRGVPLLLALGWGLHVAWDVFLHLDGAGAVYTPDWYPWLCVSFDFVIAGAVLKTIRDPARSTETSSRPPAHEPRRPAAD